MQEPVNVKGGSLLQRLAVAIVDMVVLLRLRVSGELLHRKMAARLAKQLKQSSTARIASIWRPGPLQLMKVCCTSYGPPADVEMNVWDACYMAAECMHDCGAYKLHNCSTLPALGRPRHHNIAYRI